MQLLGFFIYHSCMKVFIRKNSLLAKLAASKLKANQAAIVIGSTIHLHNTSREEFLADKEWLCHELKHVEQYQQHGFAGFLVKYLFEWVKNGYYNNRFEKEARENELNISLLEKVSIT